MEVIDNTVYTNFKSKMAAGTKWRITYMFLDCDKLRGKKTCNNKALNELPT